MKQSVGTELCAVYYEWVLVVIACNVFQTTGEQAQRVGATVTYKGRVTLFHSVNM
jgi:hypothetical protein